MEYVDNRASGDKDDDEEDISIPPTATFSSSKFVGLQLDSEIYININFEQLRQTFPAVTSLDIRSLSANNVVSLEQILGLWPDLKEIQLKGETRGVWCNYDAEFCGVSKEEREYRGDQALNFFSRFHLVPIMLCLSTLPS